MRRESACEGSKTNGRNESGDSKVDRFSFTAHTTYIQASRSHRHCPYILRPRRGGAARTLPAASPLRQGPVLSILQTALVSLPSLPIPCPDRILPRTTHRWPHTARHFPSGELTGVYLLPSLPGFRIYHPVTGYNRDQSGRWIVLPNYYCHQHTLHAAYNK